MNIIFSFYEMTDNPIDILKIQQKMKADEYPTMEDFKVNTFFCNGGGTFSFSIVFRIRFRKNGSGSDLKSNKF